MTEPDNFEEFIALCKECLGNSKKGLVKLVKKRYREADDDYIESEDFTSLLDRTRQSIVKDKKRLFVHLKDFLDALKVHKGAGKSHDSNDNHSRPLSKKAKFYHSDECSGVESGETYRGNFKLFEDSELGSSVSESETETERKYAVVENITHGTTKYMPNDLETGVNNVVETDTVSSSPCNRDIEDEVENHIHEETLTEQAIVHYDNVEHSDSDASSSDLPPFVCNTTIEIHDSQNSEEHIELNNNREGGENISNVFDDDIIAATGPVTNDQFSQETAEQCLNLEESVENNLDDKNASMEDGLEYKNESMEDKNVSMKEDLDNIVSIEVDEAEHIENDAAEHNKKLTGNESDDLKTGTVDIYNLVKTDDKEHKQRHDFDSVTTVNEKDKGQEKEKIISGSNTVSKVVNEKVCKLESDKIQTPVSVSKKRKYGEFTSSSEEGHQRVESPEKETLDHEDSDSDMSEEVYNLESDKSQTAITASKKRKYGEFSSSSETSDEHQTAISVSKKKRKRDEFSSSSEKSTDSEENRRVRERCRKKGVISVGKKNKIRKMPSQSHSPARSGQSSGADRHSDNKALKRFGNSPKKKSPQKMSPIRGSPNKRVDIVIITDSESSSDCDLTKETFDRKLDKKYGKKHSILTEKNSKVSKIKNVKTKDYKEGKYSSKWESPKVNEPSLKLKIKIDDDSVKMDQVKASVNAADTSKRRVELIKVSSPDKTETITEASSYLKNDQEEKLSTVAPKAGTNQGTPEIAGPSHEPEDSKAKPEVSDDPSKKKASSKQIKRLERLLQQIRDKIEEVRSRELGLDDLDSEVSDYLLEDKLQHKLMKVWNKLCELHKASKITGRQTEKYFHYQGTRYPVINRKIEKLVNKKKIFPDYHDIRAIIAAVSKEKRLHLRVRDIDDLAREAFTDVGNRLQERRQKDLVSTFKGGGVNLYNSYDDPALYDPELKKKLETNRKTGKTRMDQIVEKYNCLQMEEGDRTDEEDDEEEEEELAAEEAEKENDLEIDAVIARSMVDNSDSEKDEHNSPCLEIENIESGTNTKLDLHRPGDVEKLQKFKGSKPELDEEVSEETSFAAMLGLKSVERKREIVKEEVKQEDSVSSRIEGGESKAEPVTIEVEGTIKANDSNHQNSIILNKAKPVIIEIEDIIQTQDVIQKESTNVSKAEPVIIEIEDKVKANDISQQNCTTKPKHSVTIEMENKTKTHDSKQQISASLTKPSGINYNALKEKQPCIVVDEEDVIFIGDSKKDDLSKNLYKDKNTVVKKEIIEGKMREQFIQSSHKNKVKLKDSKIEEVSYCIIDLCNDTPSKETKKVGKETITTETDVKTQIQELDSCKPRTKAVECIGRLDKNAENSTEISGTETYSKATGYAPDGAIASSSSSAKASEDVICAEESSRASESEESDILIPLITRKDPDNEDVSDQSESDSENVERDVDTLDETVTDAERENAVFGPTSFNVIAEPIADDKNNKNPLHGISNKKQNVEKSVAESDGNGAESWCNEFSVEADSKHETENESDKTLMSDSKALDELDENDDDDKEDDDLCRVTETELEGSTFGSSVSDIFRDDTPVDEKLCAAENEEKEGNKAVGESEEGTSTVGRKAKDRNDDTVQEPDMVDTCQCDQDQHYTVMNEDADDELEITSTSIISSSHISSVTEKLKHPEVKNNLIKLEKASNLNRVRIYPVVKQKPRTEPLWLEEDEHADLIENYVEPDSSVYSQDEMVISSSHQEDVIVLSDSE